MEGSVSASAVINVTTENKIISANLKEGPRDSEGCSTLSLDNSLVQSPSIESFSTFQDVETMSELNMDQDSDLWVRVDNPQKQLETLETYILFRVITKVARIDYQESEYVVRRRYNDFNWLRSKLVETYPTHIVPPLPAKHSLIGQLDRYSKDFIITRMNMLNIFTTRVANHPILTHDINFKMFLTAKPSEFVGHRKNKSTILTKVSDSFYNITTAYVVKHRSIEFEKFKEYAIILQEKLSMIEKISQRINKERQDYATELNYFYPLFIMWAGTEPSLAGVLTKMGHAVERTANAQTNMISDYLWTLGNPLREFLMYIDVVRDVLHKRDNYQLAYESSIDDLSKKRNEKDQLVIASQTATTSSAHFTLWKQASSDQKLEKLGTHIPQLMKYTENLQDRLECANEALRSDLERWQLEKQSNLKKILMDFASKQIEYYEFCVEAWETVISDTAGSATHEIPLNCN